MASRVLSQKYSFVMQNGFDGGLSSENAIAIAPNKMVIADNILIGTAPTRRKRGGKEKYHTGSFDQTASYPASGEAIRGIIEYWRTASVGGNPISDVFVHQDTKVWSIDNRTTIGVNRTGILGLSAISIPSYQVFNQKLYFCSTITADGYNKWDGNALGDAVAATEPLDGPGKYLCAHLGRMVMAGNNDYPFRVYLSSALDPEDWTSSAPSNATSFDLDDNGDPEGITGIISFQNRLYVFTRRSIYEITGTDPATAVVQRISDGIGCVSHASIASIPNDVIFCSDRGVHSLRQVASGRQTETTFISRDIQRMWTELINASRFNQVMAAYDETINSYIITVPSAAETTNADCLVYNIEFGTWTMWKDINARSITVGYVNNKKQLLIGQEDGKIAFLNRASRNDFGDSYSARFKTGIIYPGNDLTLEKRFVGITVLASCDSPAIINVEWDIDGKKNGSRDYRLDSSEDVLGTTFVLGQSILGIGQYTPQTFDIGQHGVGIQLTFTVQSPGDVEFYGFILEVENENPLFVANR